MQLPEDLPLERTSSSVFDQLLQQYSMNDIDREDSAEAVGMKIEKEAQIPASHQDVWFKLDEVPQEHILPEEGKGDGQADVVEFRRVRSLREEQEHKIAQFMREDRLIKAVGPLHDKKDSPVGKGWQSLSPKKTKKIEKGRWLSRASSYITE